MGKKIQKKKLYSYGSLEEDKMNKENWIYFLCLKNSSFNIHFSYTRLVQWIIPCSHVDTFTMHVLFGNMSNPINWNW